MYVTLGKMFLDIELRRTGGQPHMQ